MREADEPVKEALERALEAWLVDNGPLLDNGLYGDVEDLLSRLLAASTKSPISAKG